jgi:hypothetical protein
VGDGGGPQSYAFLTDSCLQRMPPPFDLPLHSDAGTTVHYRFRLEGGGMLTRLRFLIIRPAGRTMLIRSGKRLRRILDEDAATER